jgi:antitoxin component YwqK of YwqJK toxin-antitoxin module
MELFTHVKAKELWEGVLYFQVPVDRQRNAMDMLGKVPTILEILPWDVFTENIFTYFNTWYITAFQSINKTAKQLVSTNGRRIYEVCLHPRPHGQVVYYFKNRDHYGQIESRRHYRDTKRHGIFEVYRPLTIGTVLFLVENYVNGQMHGERKEFHSSNGQLKSRCLHEYHKKQGKEEEWFASGQICKEKQWKDGLAHGEERQWLECGILRFVKFFESGVCKRVLMKESITKMNSAERSRKRARYDNAYKLLVH